MNVWGPCDVSLANNCQEESWPIYHPGLPLYWGYWTECAPVTSCFYYKHNIICGNRNLKGKKVQHEAVKRVKIEDKNSFWGFWKLTLDLLKGSGFKRIQNLDKANLDLTLAPGDIWSSRWSVARGWRDHKVCRASWVKPQGDLRGNTPYKKWVRCKIWSDDQRQKSILKREK